MRLWLFNTKGEKARWAIPSGLRPKGNNPSGLAFWISPLLMMRFTVSSERVAGFGSRDETPVATTGVHSYMSPDLIPPHWG